MKVVHIASECGKGGAARCALNLHIGLLELGVDSTFAVGEIHGTVPLKTVKIPSMTDGNDISIKTIECLLSNNRSEYSNTHYSLNIPGWDCSKNILLQEADVINLHWVAGGLSASSISALATFSKPVVWTLHDMRPLTGGCHFPAGCAGFEHDCTDCPQLLHDPNGLISKNKLLASRALKQSDIHLVAPSSWMLERVKKATSAANNQSTLIPYGLDTDHFKLGEKHHSRRRLGLDPKAIYILLAANHARELRKGFDNAERILEELRKDPDMDSAVVKGAIRVLLCGNDSSGFCLSGYKTDCIGHLEFESMPLLYQAADLLLFTSLEDNLPNVVMEALSCGLTVVGHDLGGIRDLLGRDVENELLFPIGHTKLACTIIKKLINDPSSRAIFGINGRKRMEIMFSIEQQAKKYMQLYGDLMVKPHIHSNSERVTREEEYGIIIESFCDMLMKQNESSNLLHHEILQNRIMKGSKWVRLGQALGFCHRP